MPLIAKQFSKLASLINWSNIVLGVSWRGYHNKRTVVYIILSQAALYSIRDLNIYRHSSKHFLIKQYKKETGRVDPAELTQG